MDNLLTKKKEFTIFDIWLYAKQHTFRSTIYVFVASMIQITFPVFLKKLIKWVVDKKDKSHQGILWVFVISLMMMIRYVFFHRGTYQMQLTQTKVNNLLNVRT